MRLKHSQHIFLLIMALLTLGCAETVVRTNGNDSLPSEPLGRAGETTQEEPSAAHPVSLVSLMNKTYTGTDLQIGKVLAENESYTRYYITYKSGDLKISGIMNVPKSTGPFPALILNHGHIDTSVYTNGRGLKREQDYLARRGYVVLHPDYRNHAESDDDPNSELSLRLGYTEDVINAVLALRAAQLPYVDAENIGMLGHSMGGGITQNVIVTQPDLIKAAVLFAPVSSDYRENYEKWTKMRTETASKIVAAYGTPDENPEFWSNVSSRTFFNNVTVPVMIHHGTQDESCPLEWSQATAQALEGLGKEVILHEYPGEPHEFINAWPTVMDRTADFFDQYLKKLLV